MLLREYYKKVVENNELQTINLSDITLTECIHKNGMKKYPKNVIIDPNVDINKLFVIVTPISNGKYKLLTRWKDYVTALDKSTKTIQAHIIRKIDSRKIFLKAVALQQSVSGIRLEDVIILDDFLKTTPNPRKIKLREEDIENNWLVPSIILTADNILLDGYATYLAAKNLGYERLSVTYMERKTFEKFFGKKKKSKKSYAKIN